MKRILAGLAIVSVAAACSSRHDGKVALYLSTMPPVDSTGAPNRPNRAPDSVLLVSAGPDTLILREAAVVLRDLKLAPVEAGECDETEEEDREAECADLRVDLTLYPLPLQQGAFPLDTVRAAPETYTLVQLQLSPPDSAGDRKFLRRHPDLAGVSVRARGTWSHAGQRRDFSYDASFPELLEVGIDPGQTLAAGEILPLTLRFDVGSWFATADRRGLVDPATAGPDGPNRHLVQDNVRTSVAMFRDANHDGLDDHHAAPHTLTAR